MPIFMNTGGGDIYAAETKEACIAAMRKDVGDEVDEWLEEGAVHEVSGDLPMRVDSDGDKPSYKSTLAKEYTNLGYGYCIASENC